MAGCSTASGAKACSSPSDGSDSRRWDKDAIVRRLAGRQPRHDRSDDNTARLLGSEEVAARLTRTTGTLRDAAVLVPLVERTDGLTVLLTRRTDHLAHHAGQVSFPGGQVETVDKDAAAAALRETAEEIGLDPAAIEILGRLDDYVTVTGFRVVPVVGLVHPPLAVTLDPFEVADVFEVPLAFLLDPANHQRHFRVLPDGTKRHYYAMPYQSHYIWGATAGMLINLFEVLGGPCAS